MSINHYNEVDWTEIDKFDPSTYPPNRARVLTYREDWIPEIKQVRFFENNPNDRDHFLEVYSHWAYEIKPPNSK